jgi:hypothetical protein
MEIIGVFQNNRDNILCNIILDRLVWPLKAIRPLRDASEETSAESRKKSNLRRIIGCTFLFLMCFSFLTLALWLSHQAAKTSLVIAIITAAIASLSFYVISWNYDYIVDQVSEALSISPLGNDLDKRLSSWVKNATNPWYQLSGSLLSILIIAAVLYLIVNERELSLEQITKFTVILIVVFSMGQGGYWAIVSPLFTRELSNGSISELGVNPVYPSRSPILISASKFLSVASISDAVMVTLCLISLFVIRPRFSNGLIYPVIIVLSGYLLTTWNFLLPQLNLARIIQRAKKNTLNEISLEVNKLYSRLDSLSTSEFERLEHLMKLHDAVGKGPNTMINFVASRSLVGSLLTPTLVGIIGIVDWKSLLQRLPTTLR